jgi:hypothetical protein
MAWNQNYWDMIHSLYWSPEMIGLEPLKVTPDLNNPSHMSVPKTSLSNGSLRRRAKKDYEVREALHGDERTLNAFFDIMFAIAPDRIIEQWFCGPLGISDNSQFRSFGLLELTERYNLGNKNVTQPDGFFVSERSIICVEIKLTAISSVKQILKYASLIALEERRSHRRKNIGLLYVAPEQRAEKLWKSLGLTGASLDQNILASTDTQAFNNSIRTIIESDREHFEEILGRLKLAVISWSELYQRATNEKDSLDQQDSAQQTLYRLLDGFIAQLRAHRDTGLNPGSGRP